MNNISYLLALHSVDGLGPIRLKRLLDFYEDPKNVWEANLTDLRNLRIPQSVLSNLSEAKKTLDPEKYIEEILKGGIKVLSIYDENYPTRLKQIYDPPIILYYKGEIKPEDFNSIAIVGTRKITSYGKLVTQKFSFELASLGLTIVSGLARGVDTIAHLAALEAKGRTLAILGGGLNKIFPQENTLLAEKITQGFGAVISEFPPNNPSLPGNFPARNRIIAGLSQAVIVTEAAQDSGSLITARFAINEGREVFAVPGPITSDLSKGPADLIKDGAKLVYSLEDILTELGIDGKTSLTPPNISNLPKLESLILTCLSETKHIDEICRELQKSPSEISAGLLKMEIQGIVKSMGNGSYIRY